MVAALDLTNKRFGRLVVTQKHPDKSNCGKVQWICQCDCGAVVTTATSSLTTGNTKSCGCQRVDSSRLNGLNNKTHGMTGTPEYKAWQSMKDRCENTSNQNYSNYGGRGITVCDRWRDSFENFYADMGPRPDSSLSVDREDVNGNYDPINCRWADFQTQSSNKRNNVRFEVNGEILIKAEIARRTNIPIATLDTRLRGGYSIAEAIGMEKRQRLITYQGVTKNLSQWADDFGISYGKLYQRHVVLGWSFDRAISEK